MKILHFVPGSGDASYCENCLRDGDLLDALVGLGHEVVAVPLYLPPMLETESVSLEPLFFGGINVYLRQRFRSYKGAPGWLTRLLDRPAFLEAAGRRAGTTDPAALAATAQSMLDGESGSQALEYSRTMAWLDALDGAPDVAVLSNALLAGFARIVLDRLGIPVVTLLQDEHEFLDLIPEPHSAPLRAALNRSLADVSLAVAVSRYYGGTVAPQLGFEAGRTAVVYPGIRCKDFPLSAGDGRPPGLGFLSRWSPDKGPHRLAKAYLDLRSRTRWSALQLHFAGGFQSSDQAYIGSWRGPLAEAEKAGLVTFSPTFDLATRRLLFERVPLVVVTEEVPPAYRRYVLEALSSGAVVLAPALGCFPELEPTLSGGLVLYEPDDDLTVLIDGWLQRPDELASRGRAASGAVATQFDASRSAQELIHLLEQLV